MRRRSVGLSERCHARREVGVCSMADDRWAGVAKIRRAGFHPPWTHSVVTETHFAGFSGILSPSLRIMEFSSAGMLRFRLNFSYQNNRTRPSDRCHSSQCRTKITDIKSLTASLGHPFFPPPSSYSNYTYHEHRYRSPAANCRPPALDLNSSTTR